MTNQILMSKDNPTGWKLEELLLKAKNELGAKTTELDEKTATEPDGDKKEVMIDVLANNRAIVHLLEQAINYQEGSMLLLDKLGADPGPEGKPRI